MRLKIYLSLIVLLQIFSSGAYGQLTKLDTIERNMEAPSLLDLLKGGKGLQHQVSKKTLKKKTMFIKSKT